MTFLMKDGSYAVIMYQDDNHFPRLVRIMGKPELADDPRYNSRANRMVHRQFLHGLIQEWASTVTLAEVEPILEANGLPFGKVMNTDDLLRDPHVKARNDIQYVELLTKEVVPLVGVLPKLSDTPGSIRWPSPHLGQHNEDVYHGLLGFSQKEIDQLKAEKVI